MHGPTKVELSSFQKLSILIQLAKILNTFHCFKHRSPWAHGNLNSHNVFVQLEPSIRVQIDGIELTDLKKYANLFLSYKSVSVWSPPEVLQAPRKMQDPCPTMDVYSFGFLMWEIFHE